MICTVNKNYSTPIMEQFMPSTLFRKNCCFQFEISESRNFILNQWYKTKKNRLHPSSAECGWELSLKAVSTSWKSKSCLSSLIMRPVRMKLGKTYVTEIKFGKWRFTLMPNYVRVRAILSWLKILPQLMQWNFSYLHCNKLSVDVWIALTECYLLHVVCMKRRMCMCWYFWNVFTLIYCLLSSDI